MHCFTDLLNRFQARLHVRRGGSLLLCLLAVRCRRCSLLTLELSRHCFARWGLRSAPWAFRHHLGLHCADSGVDELRNLGQMRRCDARRGFVASRCHDEVLRRLMLLVEKYTKCREAVYATRVEWRRWRPESLVARAQLDLKMVSVEATRCKWWREQNWNRG